MERPVGVSGSDRREFFRWATVALLMVFMMINFMDKVVLGMVAAPLMSDLKLSPTEFGILGGSFYWLYAVSGIVLGMVGNRVTSRTMLFWLALSWSVFQLPIFFSSSFTVLLACRVLLGVGEGPAWPLAVHAIFKQFSNERRALPVALLTQGAGAGLVLAGVLIPAITQFAGWRGSFLVLSASGLAWALLWICFKPAGTEHEVGKGAQPESGAKPERVPYRHLLLNKTVIAVIVMHLALGWTLGIVFTWLPSYLGKGLGFSPVAAGRMFSFFVIVNAPVNVILCAIAQKMLRSGFSSRVARGLFTGAAFLAGGLLLFVPSMPGVDPILKVIALAVSFGAVTVINSLGAAMLGEVSPEPQRAGLLAVDTAISSVGGVISPIVMGIFIQWAASRAGSVGGYESGLAIGGALLFVAGIVGLFLAKPGESAQKVKNASERGQADRAILRKRGGVSADIEPADSKPCGTERMADGK